MEFNYYRKMENMRPLIGENALVPYTTLLKELHLPKVHVSDNEEPIEMCPLDCSQKQSCLRIRKTLRLVKVVTQKLGEKNQVFEGLEVSMIGSTREGSRAFYNHEVDIHLSLNHDLIKLCYFDVEVQALLKRGNSGARNPDVAKYFDNTNNTFLPGKFFHDFVSFVHSIISALKMPNNFSMLPLTTSFQPCTKCMTTGLREAPAKKKRVNLAIKP